MEKIKKYINDSYYREKVNDMFRVIAFIGMIGFLIGAFFTQYVINM